ncbi:MAG: type II secretion system F family protein [Rhodospirillales bacterium]|nr:type II secretion system F family protein [Rhodospirillales bacterium]
MDFPTFIMWALVFGGAASVLFFGMSLVKGGKRAKRIKAVVSQHRGDLSRKQTDGLNRPSAIRQQKEKAHVRLVNKLLGAINLQDMLSSKEIGFELAQAGLRGRGVIPAYVSTRVLMAIGAAIGTMVVLGLAKEFPYPEFVKFIFAGGGGVVGFFLPKVLLKNTIAKRQKDMTRAFPDCLDLLTICVESGLGIEAAFARVTEEIAEASPTLAQEFGLLTAELAYLSERRIAYQNFTNRTGLPTAKALSTALIQSEQYGTPVGIAIKVLSQEKRDERMSAAERKAAALPAKLTVPMIIFFLPVLFVVVIGPAAMQF